MTPQSQPPQPELTQIPQTVQSPLTPQSIVSETDRALEQIAHGLNHDPFAVLGPHVEIRDGRPSFVIRTCQPFATRVEVSRADGETMPMRRLTQGGGIIFEAVFGGVAAIFDYRLRVTDEDGRVTQIDDPYRYGRVLGDLDLHL